MIDNVSERDWQRTIVETAQWFGWAVYHTHDSRRSQPGFPDLVLARPPRLIFAEIKTRTGKMTAAQSGWIDTLDATCAEAYVWRPVDWPAVLSLLSHDGNVVAPDPRRRSSSV